MATATAAGKAETIFECSHCGAQHSKWSGRCDECGKWNTLEAAVGGDGGVSVESAKVGDVKSAGLDTFLAAQDVERVSSGLVEMDRVLGGGLVAGGLVVLGGEPGIGKSTLVMQVCGVLAGRGGVLYVSGEESGAQVGARAKRLGVDLAGVGFAQETRFEAIEKMVRKEKPRFLVVDSIHTTMVGAVESPAGSVAQVKAVTDRLVALVKELGVPTVLVGHVTKEGVVAGPKMLEHMVDAVLYLEGDKDQQFRVLRAVKNRYGSTGEVGIFEMRSSGLAEVSNPSKLFLANRAAKGSGSVISATTEGTRSVLIEVQALTQQTNFGYPKRTGSGFDQKRLELLLAVLGKRGGLELQDEDVYVNVTGGFATSDRGLDLAVCAAVASSFLDTDVDESVVVFGEVGLLGEVRSVSGMDKRIREAVKMGFRHLIVPKLGKKFSLSAAQKEKLEVTQVANVQEMLAALKRK